MNKFVLLIIAAVCSANYSFSQNQVMSLEKKTVTNTDKGAVLLNATDSLTKPSGICVMDLRKSVVSAKDTTGTPLLKPDSPAPKELYLNNAKIIAPPLKDDK